MNSPEEGPDGNIKFNFSNLSVIYFIEFPCTGLQTISTYLSQQLVKYLNYAPIILSKL